MTGGNHKGPALHMLRTPLAHIAAPLCRPSPETCAEDYAWFRERLADPDLLDRAVGVKVSGAVLLAVPAGGHRSGGYLSVGSVADAVRVWAALRGHPGFRRIRLGLSVHRDTCHTVDWGPRQPWDDAERGRYFGYAPSAIDSFLHHVSMFDQPPEPAMSEPDQAGVRNWQQDPLLSTLRDVGGCLAVILMGVLVTVLVSAARGTWPLIGTAPSPLVIHRTSQDQR
ncbi:DUF6302 family protein [Actinacidiphila sp. ITFR-21]|uniref:DUF6302 family protein n=1 Tax=Actinacidiphila sp. ITFR-21 TaxID=3075199 RepID=UPI00288A1EF2|nr:DUF6302 family protein [Streptomyces sp. ITFR-21]WNI20071.1 DUF6302 family protein [Streptomyces sp. ITFR-21]